MPIHYSVRSSSSLATNKMLGFHVKLLLVATIASFSVDGVHFHCAFDIYSPAERGSAYRCYPKVTLSGSTTLENVTGVHESGQLNDNVEFLLIAEQNLPFVPQGIVKFFKNLTALQFYKTGLLSISAKDLKPFPQLEMLLLFRNNLKTIDGDLFLFTIRLKYVDLSSNQIQHIGQDLVTNLNNLERLYLQRNICIDRDAETPDEVAELAPQLSILCPPLDVTTTIATTTTVTITDRPIVQCSCNDEIAELRGEKQQQNKQIEELQQSIDQLIQVNEKQFKQNSAVEKRLLEVEMKLREISSNSN